MTHGDAVKVADGPYRLLGDFGGEDMGVGIGNEKGLGFHKGSAPPDSTKTEWEFCLFYHRQAPKDKRGRTAGSDGLLPRLSPSMG